MLSSLFATLKFLEWCRRGDTNSFTRKIVKIARKFEKSAESLRFASLSNFFLVSLILSILSGALS